LDDFELPPIRPVIWIGTSKKNLQDFPKDVQKLIGDELQLIQFGAIPTNTKPFKGIGSGVFEIAIRPSSSNGTENNAKAESLIGHSFQPSIFQIVEPLNRCKPCWAKVLKDEVFLEGSAKSEFGAPE
jgi:hypothetical protein